MTTHTPGPWSYIPSARVIVTNKPRPDDLAEVVEFRHLPTSANAALIVAAPELLRALESVERLLDGSQPRDIPGALMVVRSAIVLAGGAK